MFKEVLETKEMIKESWDIKKEDHTMERANIWVISIDFLSL